MADLTEGIPLENSEERPKSKIKRSKNYSRNIGAGERPTFYCTLELMNEIDAQRVAEGESKSALIAKVLTVVFQSQADRELHPDARIHRRTLVSELENFLAAPTGLVFYQELLEAAAKDDRDRTQMLMHLVRLD